MYDIHHGCFSIFQDGGRPPSWIFESLKFYLPVRFRVPIRVKVPNLPTFTSVHVRYHAKFRTDRSSRFGDMTIFRFFDGGVRHLRFVLRVFGPPTTTKSIWWSLSLCKIWM